MRLRRRIGFIFQNHNLLGFLTARQNVAMALELDGAHARARAAGARRRDARAPSGLAGHEDKRAGAALGRAAPARRGRARAGRRARAWCWPTSRPRRSTRRRGAEVVQLLRDLAKSRGVPILMVTHDPRILDIADRIVAMEDGRILPSEQAAGVPAA